MISAGDPYGNQMPPQQQGYYNPGGYPPGYPGGPGGGYYGQQQAGPTLQAPQGTSWTKVGSGGGMNFSVAGKLSETHTKEMMDKQMAWNGAGMISDSVGQTISTCLNAALQTKSINAQLSVATKYYETQDKIAGYQRDVAIRQLAVQEKAINAQQEMHGEQMSHEEKMLKLEGSVNAQLESIKQAGQSNRCKIMASQAAFQDAFRSGWDMGSPAIAA